eukprot:TRINITY_DN3828_c0_g1_i1.p1 TRINITY_DN3828_c0_g1~~TRINITY_DN3828_c0_g1_i1.p1  ORF type:complete len:289 (-),score=111.82 TRINITY_DN3828_c0_g1_i1:81-947(-)
MPEKEEISGAVSFTAGGVGGVFQVLSGHPLDTMKIRLVSSPAGTYAGLGDCIKQTIAKEGFGGLYRGVGSPLIGFVALNAVLFSANEAALKALRKPEHGDGPLPLERTLIAGGFAGLAAAFVESPFDLLKTKMQTQPTPAIYRSVFHAATTITKSYGAPGIYQGLVATIFRNVPANAFYFAAYQQAQTFLRGDSHDLSPLKTLLAGGIGGMGYWLFCYPLDAIKSIIQSDHADPKQRVYRTYVQSVRKVLAERGVGGFFKGFTPCIIRAFPANAFCFLGYELTLKILA